MIPLVARFGEMSGFVRALTRWSARVLAASFLLTVLSAQDEAGSTAPAGALCRGRARQPVAWAHGSA
jgi:hypothetical protein